MMNEPHRGYVDLPSLHEFDYNTDLHLREIRACYPPCVSLASSLMLSSFSASAFASFMLGAGHPTHVPFYARSFPMPTKLSHHVLLNENGRTVWLKDGPTKGLCCLPPPCL